MALNGQPVGRELIVLFLDYALFSQTGEQYAAAE